VSDQASSALPCPLDLDEEARERRMLQDVLPVDVLRRAFATIDAERAAHEVTRKQLEEANKHAQSLNRDRWQLRRVEENDRDVMNAVVRCLSTHNKNPDGEYHACCVQRLKKRIYDSDRITSEPSRTSEPSDCLLCSNTGNAVTSDTGEPMVCPALNEPWHKRPI
jgi:hypothetical protein